MVRSIIYLSIPTNEKRGQEISEARRLKGVRAGGNVMVRGYFVVKRHKCRAPKNLADWLALLPRDTS